MVKRQAFLQALRKITVNDQRRNGRRVMRAKLTVEKDDDRDVKPDIEPNSVETKSAAMSYVMSPASQGGYDADEDDDGKDDDEPHSPSMSGKSVAISVENKTKHVESIIKMIKCCACEKMCTHGLVHMAGSDTRAFPLCFACLPPIATVIEMLAQHIKQTAHVTGYFVYARYCLNIKHWVYVDVEHDSTLATQLADMYLSDTAQHTAPEAFVF